MRWFVWGLLLFVQNASFTLVSRARNSSSMWYHAWAGVASNGVWFASQLILVDEFIRIIKTGSWSQGALVAAFYTACTLSGSLAMHWLALHKLEKKGAPRARAN